MSDQPERVEIMADPRISNLRPSWLADDQQWRDQLQAMELDDVHWIERHWADAGGAEPAIDTLWITMTCDNVSPWWVVLVVAGVLAVSLGGAGLITAAFSVAP